jgi:hypothetical protein
VGGIFNDMSSGAYISSNDKDNLLISMNLARLRSLLAQMHMSVVMVLRKGCYLLRFYKCMENVR